MTHARRLLTITLLAVMTACADPTVTDPSFGKGGSTGDPTVTGTSPTDAPRDTTLDLRVYGSNFDRGSRVDLGLEGVVGPTVRTNSTRYVSATELVANVTIAATADTGAYDVMVTASTGKKGIGTEMFRVRNGPKPPSTVLSAAAPELLLTSQGTGETQARAIGPQGWVLGVYYKAGPFGGTLALTWDPATMSDAAVLDPGSIWTGANDHGDAAGNGNGGRVFLASVGTMGGPFSVAGVSGLQGATSVSVHGLSDSHLLIGYSDPPRTAVVWLPRTATPHDDPSPGWDPVALPLPKASYPDAVFPYTTDVGGVNDLGEIVSGFDETPSGGRPHAWLWRLEGSGASTVVVSVGELPRYPGADWHSASDINDAGVVAGGVKIGPSWKPAIWFPVAGELPHRYADPPVVFQDATSWSHSELNSCGWVTGFATFSAGTEQAFVWNGQLPAVLLRAPDGAKRTRAFDINDRGDVVGLSAMPLDKRTTVGRATRWLGAVERCQ